jgi:hypothetical protein
MISELVKKKIWLSKIAVDQSQRGETSIIASVRRRSNNSILDKNYNSRKGREQYCYITRTQKSIKNRSKLVSALTSKNIKPKKDKNQGNIWKYQHLFIISICPLSENTLTKEKNISTKWENPPHHIKWHKLFTMNAYSLN